MTEEERIASVINQVYVDCAIMGAKSARHWEWHANEIIKGLLQDVRRKTIR